MDKNSFAPLPPMGWNSYDYYDTTVDEAALRANGDYMAKHLKKYGWEYIVADIQWYASHPGSMRDQFQYIPFGDLAMDEYSRLLPDPVRFPSSADGKGFRPLADYLHSLGLKFGIHIMRGIPRIAAHRHAPVWGGATADMVADPSSICAWNPDMYGVRDTPEGQVYYNSLLQLYASWGVDFIKCDDICNTNAYPHNPYAARHEVEMLAKAIRLCGRPIVLSLSPGPALLEQAWHYGAHANMWRITDDFWDNWTSLKAMFHRCELWQEHVSPGCYPDCDMLPLGRIGKGFGRERATNFTPQEQRTMMTLWCLFGSPLMLGAELTKLDAPTLSLLTNEGILAMRSPACRPRQICRGEDRAVWAAHGTNAAGEEDASYLALFNLKDQENAVTVSLRQVEEVCAMPENAFSRGIRLLPLWGGSPQTLWGDVLTVMLPAHGCAAYRLL